MEDKRHRKGEGGGFTQEMRYGRKGRGEERGGAWLQRERERERKIRSLFPFPGHDMINRFLLI